MEFAWWISNVTGSTLHVLVNSGRNMFFFLYWRKSSVQLDLMWKTNVGNKFIVCTQDLWQMSSNSKPPKGYQVELLQFFLWISVSNTMHSFHTRRTYGQQISLFFRRDQVILRMFSFSALNETVKSFSSSRSSVQFSQLCCHKCLFLAIFIQKMSSSQINVIFAGFEFH